MTTTVIGQNAPIEINLVIFKGYDWSVDFDWLDADGNPMSMVGREMSVVFEQSTLGGQSPPTLSTGDNGGITFDPDTGNIVWALTAEQTAGLDFSSVGFVAAIDTQAEPTVWAWGRARLK